jgi:hypothetical protein
MIREVITFYFKIVRNTSYWCNGRMKSSGSARMHGSLSESVDAAAKRKMGTTMSFVGKHGWNGIFSVSRFNPIGLSDPLWCQIVDVLLLILQ